MQYLLKLSFLVSALYLGAWEADFFFQVHVFLHKEKIKLHVNLI